MPVFAMGSPEPCAQAPVPVLSLDYGSRYVQSDAPGTRLDSEADSRATEELKPVDDFLRDLARLANQALAENPDPSSVANCVLAQIAVWADANALEDLRTETAQLTIGSRISSFGMVVLQVMDHTTNPRDLAVVGEWLRRMMTRQMIFWEEKAPDGAKRGNLRAWAALAGTVTAAIVDDPVIRGWSAWSIHYVLCTANADGSLPQEMLRGKYAFHYHLFAVTPLVVATTLLERQGISVQSTCNGALGRVVNFALDDMETGSQTAAITGLTQSYFDGSGTLKSFSLAWIEAYLALAQVPQRDRIEALARTYRPLSFSKLGGNQTLIWQSLIQPANP